MEHIVTLLKRHGITELVLLLFHQPEIIKKYFGDGSEFGVRITYVTRITSYNVCYTKLLRLWVSLASVARLGLNNLQFD